MKRKKSLKDVKCKKNDNNKTTKCKKNTRKRKERKSVTYNCFWGPSKVRRLCSNVWRFASENMRLVEGGGGGEGVSIDSVPLSSV